MIDVDDDDVFNDDGVVIFDNADVVDADVVYDITDDDDVYDDVVDDDVDLSVVDREQREGHKNSKVFKVSCLIIFQAEIIIT